MIFKLFSEIIYVCIQKTNSLTVEYKFAKIKQIYMVKSRIRSWIRIRLGLKSPGSDRIRIQNTGSINIFYLSFRYVRMHNYPFHNFSFLPKLSTSSYTSYFATGRWTVPAPDPAYWYSSFHHKLFYYIIFYLSFLFLWCVFFCSYSVFTGGIDFFHFFSSIGGLPVLAKKSRRSRKRGFGNNFLRLKKSMRPWC